MSPNQKLQHLEHEHSVPRSEFEREIDAGTLTASQQLEGVLQIVHDMSEADHSHTDRESAKPLTFHVDPGHGWLEVNTKDFPDAAEFGSGFGYVRTEPDGSTTCFLEEDCEAPAFLQTHPDIKTQERHHDGKQFLRGATRLPRGPKFEWWVTNIAPRPNDADEGK